MWPIGRDVQLQVLPARNAGQSPVRDWREHQFLDERRDVLVATLLVT